MRICWSPAAANDLEGCYEFLIEKHPGLAVERTQKLYRAAISLNRFPFRGRTGATPETRELAMSPLPYIFLYSVTPEVVNILRILHTSRQRPS
jgi:plasmid stabilization system protein ParE